jgi:PKHD-type hydroxylase
LLSACPLRSRQYEDLQLSETAPAARELGDMVMQALGRSELFVSAVLPRQVVPPLFNRYDAGMTSPLQVRTDVSATLFISAPEDYDGGELVVEDTYGRHSVKLPAGDMIIYPGTSLHNVTPITRGSRIASFFWTQSLIRDDARRVLLFDLDMSIRRLSADHRGMRAWTRSPRSTTTCCGGGPTCEAGGWHAPSTRGCRIRPILVIKYDIGLIDADTLAEAVGEERRHEQQGLQQ